MAVIKTISTKNVVVRIHQPEHDRPEKEILENVCVAVIKCLISKQKDQEEKKTG